jgi:hypothetical protein
MMRALRSCVACLLLGSCSHSSRPFDRSVPIGSPSSGETVADVPVRGHVITVTTHRGSVTGELLAVGPAELILLAENDGRIVSFSEIEDVDIKLYPSRSVATGVWTGVGTATAVSHGWWLIISMPVWLISGITVSVGEAENTRVEGVKLAQLYQYARFPQGMPDTLRPKAAQARVEPPSPKVEPATPAPDAGVSPAPEPEPPAAGSAPPEARPDAGA